jgi:exodeoxyribonuclease-1
MKYVFYDTETTGTDTTFDQILQFAGILTDADLNELDRFETRCRLLPHVIPAPGALLATRVTPVMLTDPSLPSHYEMMLQIAQKLREWSPAIFTGYNTL